MSLVLLWYNNLCMIWFKLTHHVAISLCTSRHISSYITSSRLLYHVMLYCISSHIILYISTVFFCMEFHQSNRFDMIILIIIIILYLIWFDLMMLLLIWFIIIIDDIVCNSMMMFVCVSMCDMTCMYHMWISRLTVW